MRILIAAGGTGGHVYPALAVVRSLRERAPEAEFRWLGGNRGLESSIVPAEGHQLDLLMLRSLRTVDRSLNTILDPSLPLTVTEWEEWGNPIESADVYAYMKSYAPYENVEAKDYPAMLVTAGLNDPRVSYWEPAKFVARLRATKTDSNRLLMKTEMGAGHMGPSGRYDAWREEAMVLAFVLDTFGITA